jgi:hypothetical protein
MTLAPRELAQTGIAHLEDAIVCLLKEHPDGLTNAEIAVLLGIESDITQQNRNFLSWSILVRLVSANQVAKATIGKRRVVYRLS